MSTTGFDTLSPEERIAGNRQQYERRQRYQRFKWIIGGTWMASLFGIAVGNLLLLPSEFETAEQARAALDAPLYLLAALFIPMILFVVFGIIYLIRQSRAEQKTYEFTVKETKVVNSRDATYFEVYFEEIPYDCFFTAHHNGNWLEHARMKPGTRVKATVRQRRRSNHGWFYPELAALAPA